MKSHFALATLIFALTACSSSAPVPSESQDGTASVTHEKSSTTKGSGSVKSTAPTAIKPMKCTYDTDCMVQNSCLNEKCKLTGTECRFRSDCPSPRGTCVNKMCHFN